MRKSLALGLASAPLASSALPVLTRLALLAAWQRCERPKAPALVPRTQTIESEAKNNLPDPVRREFTRLAAMSRKDAAGAIITGALDAIRGAGFNLHPFDYARLEDVLSPNAERLDAGARQWLKRVQPDKDLPETLYDGPPVDESNLAQAGKRQKIAYVTERRKADPASGRALVERLFADEPAATRLDLLSTLVNSLSDEDKPFLDTLSLDRARTVRDKAQELLGFIPGTDMFAKRIERLKDDLEVKTEGLLRPRKILVYKPPANIRPHELAEAQMKLISGLSLDVIATAFDETAASLIRLARGSEKIGPLAMLFLLKAAEEGQWTILESIPDLFEDDDGSKGLALLQAGSAHLTGEARDHLIRLALPVERWLMLPNTYVFFGLKEVLGGPLPEFVASALVFTELWSTVDLASREGVADAIAPLVPVALSTRFIERFEHVAPRATQYHKFLFTLNASAT